MKCRCLTGEFIPSAQKYVYYSNTADLA